MSRPTPRLSIVVAVVFTIATICATTAGPASANWNVEESELTGTAALATTASVAEAFKLKAAGVTVECNGGTIDATGPAIQAPSTIMASSITFNGCKANESCTLATASISTVPVLAELIESASSLEATGTFKPKTKATFTTIQFTGEKCALLGTQPVTGKVTTTLPTGEERKETQEIKANASEAMSELKLGSSAAEFKGATQIKLASGQEYLLQQELSAPEPPLQTEVEGKLSAPNKKITFTVNIGGNKTVKIESINIVNGEGTFVRRAEKHCAGALPNGSKCEVEYDFKPIAPVKYRAQFQINYRVSGEVNETPMVGPYLLGQGAKK